MAQPEASEGDGYELVHAEADRDVGNRLGQRLRAITARRSPASGRYAIVVCSVRAAGDPTFDRAVARQVAVVGSERLLLARVDGKMDWDPDTQRFSAGVGSCIPPSLVAAFAREPRHVDLPSDDGGGRREQGAQLQLAAVELAAPITLEDKAALLGLEVQRFRRRLRIAAVTLAALAVATITAGLLAAQTARRNDAVRQERDVAQALLAATDAQFLADSRPEEAAGAALDAWALDPDAEATHRALVAAANSVLSRWPQQPTGATELLAAGEVSTIVTSADVEFIALGDLTGMVVVLDADSYEVMTSRRVADEPVSLGLTADGRIIALGLSSRIQLLDPTDLTTVAEFQARDDLVAVGGSMSGTELVYGDIANNIHVIDLEQTPPTTTLVVSDTPTFGDVTLDAAAVITHLALDDDSVYAHYQGGALARFGRDGTLMATTITGIPASSNIVLTEDEIAIGLANGSIAVTDRQDLEPVRFAQQAVPSAVQVLTATEDTLVGTTGGGAVVWWDLATLDTVVGSQVSAAGAVPLALRGDDVFVITDATDLRRSDSFGTENAAGVVVGEGLGSLDKSGRFGDVILTEDGSLQTLSGSLITETDLGANAVDLVNLSSAQLILEQSGRLTVVTADGTRSTTVDVPITRGFVALEADRAASLFIEGLVLATIGDDGTPTLTTVPLPGTPSTISSVVDNEFLVGTGEGVVLRVPLAALDDPVVRPDVVVELPSLIDSVALRPGGAGVVAIAAGSLYVTDDGGAIETVLDVSAFGGDLAVSGDGTLVAASLSDGRIGLWNIAEGYSLGSFQLRDGPVTSLRFEGSSQLYSTDSSRLVRRWPVSPTAVVERLCGSLPDPPDSCR